MVQFNVHEAKSNLSKLLDLALEGEEVVISRHGTPVARLTPVEQNKSERPSGFARGTVHYVSEDWYAPMTDEEADAFWEGRW